MFQRSSRGRPLNAPASFIHPRQLMHQLGPAGEVMLRRLIITIAAVSAVAISLCPTDASARRTRAAPVADSVPSWDVTASCRAAATIAYNQTPSDRFQSCLASEQRTRDELNKNWSTFPAADRISCVKSLTFSPTYTELVTCLEMRRDVANSRNAKPADTNPSR
jgi:hypothetical protein